MNRKELNQTAWNNHDKVEESRRTCQECVVPPVINAINATGRKSNKQIDDDYPNMKKLLVCQSLDRELERESHQQ